MNKRILSYLSSAFDSLDQWKASFGEAATDTSLLVDDRQFQEVLKDFLSRLCGNYPFHHPVYAGQMLKPPHEVAWLAYTLAMSINPNNHALDGGPPTSEMEKEVVSMLASFFGFGEGFLGHLTTGGTIANLEALWVASRSHPDKKIAFSENAHYTHSRMCDVLKLDYVLIPANVHGAPDLSGISPSEIGTVVCTMGTTGLGFVEPLHELLPWAKKHGIRVHIDAAYGGFFHSIRNSGLIDPAPWNMLAEADSIVVDPHKHGLQPYGCGCVLFKDPAVGRFYKHDSPYTYFTSEELHLGEISLECSRAGASAAALWFTLQLFPLEENSGFGPILSKCRNAALDFYKLLNNSGSYRCLIKPGLDIVGYFPIPERRTTSAVSEFSNMVFKRGMEERRFFISLYKMKSSDFCSLHPDFESDSDFVHILRSTLMKPEHASYVPELMKELEKTALTNF